MVILWRKEIKTMCKLNKSVFYLSSLFIGILAICTIFTPLTSGRFLTSAQTFMSENFSWYYMILMFSCVCFCLWLIFSRHGNIKLGSPTDMPEYSFLSWMFMLFSAGIGIAILYFGCYEPVEHFYNPPTGIGQTPQAAQNAMVLTFLHWGIHGWALYALMGVILSYFTYVKNYNLTIRSPLRDLLPTKASQKYIGNMVDIFSVLATIVAMVTNLGLGALVINAGISIIFGIEASITNLIIVISILTIIAAFIAILGIEHGIAIIAQINIYALCALLLYVFIDGHTAHLLDAIVQNTGDYLNNFFHLSFNMYLYQKATVWRGLWTVFYWAWWVSWAPFVGMFIAKISKGRTIRELVLCTMFIPLIFSLLWLAIFGNSTLYLIVNNSAKDLANNILAHPELSIFKFLVYLNLSKLLIIITTLISCILFFAPVDSGCIVISELSLLTHTKPAAIESPTWLRVFWCVVPCFVTIGLFLAGNFMAIQTVVVLLAFPFSFVIIAFMVSFIKNVAKS